MDKLTILGLDLSLSCPGYAVLEIKKGKPKLLESGIIKANQKHTQVQKIRRIAAHMARLAADYDIDVIVRESGFVRHNKTTKILERVAGAVISTLGEIVELPPTTIKKAVTESGKASKEEVELGVRLLLNLPADFEFKTDDESDAVAVALAYVIEQGLL
jgi:crossover junction endodeoxyribonuclease RuvC